MPISLSLSLSLSLAQEKEREMEFIDFFLPTWQISDFKCIHPKKKFEKKKI
jgi:hypothetical protein